MSMSVLKIFYQISPSAQIVNLYRNTLEKHFEKGDYHRKDAVQRTKKELEKLFWCLMRFKIKNPMYWFSCLKYSSVAI